MLESKRSHVSLGLILKGCFNLNPISENCFLELVTKESKKVQHHTQADEWKEDVLEPCYAQDYLTVYFNYVKYLH